MAFRFGDPGGRMYQVPGTSNANVLALWSSISMQASSSYSIVASGGRAAGACIRMNSVSNNAYFIKILNPQATLGVAAAFKVASLPGTSGTLITFTDAGTAQCELRIDTTGAVSVTRNGTVLGTVAGVVTPGAWVHLEVKITFGDTGSVYLGVNGVQRLNLVADTKNSANANATHVSVGMQGWNSSVDIDDIIIYDGQTKDVNNLDDIVGPIGDCRLTWLLPTAAGATTQFTPDSGANWARVSEATPDATSYVESLTVGHVDTYTMADLALTTGTVKAVAVATYARKTDAGSRGTKAVLRSGGANAIHATEVALSDSYLYSFSSYGSNPNNGSPIAWTPAAVNAVEAGQIVSS